MNIVFYDTETTGFGVRDEVIQVAGIITNMDLKIVKVFNRHCFTNSRIQPEAQAVHGIDRNKLLRLSRQKYIEEVLEEIGVFNYPNAIYAAFNDKFDKRLMNQSLINNGNSPLDFGRTIYTFERKLKKGRYNICTMNLFCNALNNGNRWKLETFIRKKAGVPYETFQEYYKIFSSKLEIATGGELFHDALFDSFSMWFLASKYKGLLFS